MSWERFERFVLDGPDSDFVFGLFWPQFIAEVLYLILEPIRRWVRR